MHYWRRLVDKSELVVSKFVRLVFLKWRPLVDRSCTSGALLRTSHELVLSKFVHLVC